MIEESLEHLSEHLGGAMQGSQEFPGVCSADRGTRPKSVTGVLGDATREQLLSLHEPRQRNQTVQPPICWREW